VALGDQFNPHLHEAEPPSQERELSSAVYTDRVRVARIVLLFQQVSMEPVAAGRYSSAGFGKHKETRERDLTLTGGGRGRVWPLASHGE
jgi:hypothetical protein